MTIRDTPLALRCGGDAPALEHEMFEVLRLVPLTGKLLFIEVALRHFLDGEMLPDWAIDDCTAITLDILLDRFEE